MDIQQLGRQAKAASHKLAMASASARENGLIKVSENLLNKAAEIEQANLEDLALAAEKGLTPAFLERLKLDQTRIASAVKDLLDVSKLPDPLSESFDEKVLPNSLHIHKQRVPVGVIGVIYESRPNVTIDVSGLAVKSGNAVILRGGKESLLTNRALVKAIQEGLSSAGLPEKSVQFIDDPNRGIMLEMLKLDQYIDMIIPRGSGALHAFCKENSRIPVITGGIGICHLFVDESANFEKSIPVIRNAKIQRPTVCNALDTVLVHENIADTFIPSLVSDLIQYGVEIRADEKAYAILKSVADHVYPAGEKDFDTEWLSLILGIKVVSGLDDAIQHIVVHSTGHSDGILTENQENAEKFINVVDSAAVYVNASTRFTDGAQLGLGAEVAISTQRLHARGPMGLRELTTYKWVVKGNYHVRP